MPQEPPEYSIELLKKIIETQNLLASANFDLQAFMQLLANEVHELTPATGTVIELVEDEYMVYKAVTGTVSNYHGLKLPVANSISGLCIVENKILISPDTEKDPRVNLDACRKIAARSLIVAPLVSSGKAVGVLKILSKYPDAFNDLHIKVLQLMAGFIASGLQHQILFQEKEQIIKKLKVTRKRLSDMTKHDFLTKLPNRKFFDTALTHAMDRVKRKKELIALMFLDIDGFKWINDNLGHSIGDAVLVKFAAFLKKNVRKYDCVVRLGGDEFVILFDDLHQKTEAITIAEKIILNLNETTFFKTQKLKISTSIGISFYRGNDLSPAELVKQADDALYLAKAAGKNTLRIYSEPQ